MRVLKQAELEQVAGGFFFHHHHCHTSCTPCDEPAGNTGDQGEPPVVEPTPETETSGCHLFSWFSWR